MVKENRRRYIIFRVIAEKPEDIKPESLGAYIWDEIKNIYGADIAANIQFAIVEKNFDPKGWNIIRVNHKYIEHMKTILSFAHLFEQPIIIRFYKVTGTIKKARQIINELMLKTQNTVNENKTDN